MLTAFADALPTFAASLPAGPAHTLAPGWMDPSTLITGFLTDYGSWAILAIALVVFVETGLLFPILPGDSLLFMAGAFTAQHAMRLPLPVVMLTLFVAAVLGNSTGYTLGRTFGARLFDRPDSRVFKRRYIDQTQRYFDAYGGRTITIAQFVPIVRTYAPVASGIGRMPFRHFIAFNALGAALWAAGITFVGYLLGNIAFVKDHVEALVLLIVAVSVVPMAVEVLRERRKLARAASPALAAGGPAPSGEGAASDAIAVPVGATVAAQGAAAGTFDDDGARPRHAR
ncbi:VTT domain-containing protein [Xylanimonas ulmi]|uniref:Membrane-associated protein n=1 Tax=Xylanimonas ulmi TaxID=228973 RepID=A0A4Q7M4R3_9MICO|nr:VTT domain-containing protein [Xylanibacterium ulmi]RZS62381.1 membrane-associated protein [Xylanibacterium ulmi]